jgi:U3 small nucleolar RNA-associated protein 21
VAQLIKDHEGGDFASSIELLIGMNHDQVAIEISGLAVSDDHDERMLFMDLIEFGLRSRRDFEMVQGFIHVFLNAFGAKILQNAPLKARLAELKTLQSEAIRFMEQDLSHAMYLIEMINRIQ